MEFDFYPRSALPLVALTWILLIQGGNALGKDICGGRDGLVVCVQMKGSCDISEVISGMKGRLQVDLFYITASNQSGQRTRVSPYDFLGVTENGQIVAIDPSFYDSLQLKRKLLKRDLGPREGTEGFLFFPLSAGRIRSLVYKGHPGFSIQLY